MKILYWIIGAIVVGGAGAYWYYHKPVEQQSQSNTVANNVTNAETSTYKADLITITLPKDEATVSSPLLVQGQMVTGQSIPDYEYQSLHSFFTIRLSDQNGHLLAMEVVKPQGGGSDRGTYFMTFGSRLVWDNSDSAPKVGSYGHLIIYRSDASGNSQGHGAVTANVVFGEQTTPTTNSPVNIVPIPSL
jgi:hypothetical protein